MAYLTVIGDIVGSKDLPNRERFQQELAVTLKRLSARHPGLVSPYTLTLGDEFQAIYKSADRLFGDLVTLLAAVSPARARFAIGVGDLTTRINPKQAIGMDGPAFHRARDVMTELKKSHRLLRIRGSTVTRKGAFDPWPLLNHSLDLASHEFSRWEKNRFEILRVVLEGKPLAELESELGISKVAIYKNVHAGALEDLRGLLAEITRFLNHQLALRG